MVGTRWFLAASLAGMHLGFFSPHRASAQTISATQEKDRSIRVVVPGVFATTFTKRNGFGHRWVDLRDDPEKGSDLAPVRDETGFLGVKAAPGACAAGSWYANPVEALDLLEDGPVRARGRLKGGHARYGNTKPEALWKELAFEQ